MENDRLLLELHRNNLNLTTVQKLYHKSLANKKISYIPYLVDMQSIVASSLAQGQSAEDINTILREMNYKTIPENDHLITQNMLHNMTTREIITKADKMFNSKMTNEEAKIIFEELKTRKDILEEILVLTGNNTDFKDDLYYWQPGLIICDIYTLLLQLFKPEQLILKYKKYIGECAILNKEYCTGLLNLLKERYSSAHFVNIDVMINDKTIFGHTDDPMKYKKIVSHEYWTDSCCKCPKAMSTLSKTGLIAANQQEGDIKFEFCCCLSFVEIEIGTVKKVTLLVPMYMLEDLYNGCVDYRSFWVAKQIIDQNGNFLVD